MRHFLAAAAMAMGLAQAGAAGTLVEKSEARLRALDKITGGSTDIIARVGEPVTFGSLIVEVKTCFQAPPEEVPESAAFLKIVSTRPVGAQTLERMQETPPARDGEEEKPVLFSGWMYASSPGLNALEHPVYDIWVIRCTAPDPVKLPDAALSASEGADLEAFRLVPPVSPEDPGEEDFPLN